VEKYLLRATWDWEWGWARNVKAKYSWDEVHGSFRQTYKDTISGRLRNNVHLEIEEL